MQELLLPGITILCTPGPPQGKHPWRVAAVRSVAHGREETILLDTGRTNRVAAELIERRVVPALEAFSIRRAEVTVPDLRGRFDFLLEHRHTGEELLLEVKSCTLFNGRYAMFPDAVTDRGARHVAELAGTDRRAALLFVVHSDRPDHFLPDYHTDLEFSRTLFEARDRLPIFAVGVRWNRRLGIEAVRPHLEIPWEILPPLLEDRGSYLILLRLDSDRTITTGALGEVRYPAGHYLYVGSAQKGLTARINRHRRGNARRKHWHIDYLREQATFVDAYAIREPLRREAEIVRELRQIADDAVPGFGSSDSTEASHLLTFSQDPRRRREFQQAVFRLRRYGVEGLPAG